MCHFGFFIAVVSRPTSLSPEVPIDENEIEAREKLISR